MKLHLPVSLHRAVLKVLAVLALPLTATVASGAGEEPPANLGNTMYVGDSITHGAYSGLYSWRWSMHKIFADNGISYTEVGVMTGNAKNGGVDMPYGETVFHNKHSAENSARASEIAERKQGSGSPPRFGGTGIQHWLRLNEPQGWTGDKTTEKYRLSESEKLVNTFFLLVGTNDLLSDSVSEGGSIGTRLTVREQELIGRSGDGSWSGNGDMDTIVNAMFEHNSAASVTILSVPTWGSHINNKTKADYEAGRTYNEHLKEWVEQNEHKENITLVDINRGLVDVANTEKPWQGVDSFFYASDGRQTNDHLHPSAQGELIIAGNVARGLGYAGRTAGQARKAATEFNRQAQAIFDSATRKDDVTWKSGKGLTFGSGATLTSDWGETSPEGTFTVDFKISGGLGDGATGGWDTQNGLTITVGDGSHSGALTLNEAYIKWGDTILYSMNMSTLTEALRLAYVRGNNAQGLPTGFYVWFGDQLIGEALSSGTAMNGGLSITNTTGNDITLTDLAMDSTSSWAPTSDGLKGESMLIEPASSSSYSGWPGVVDWPGKDKMLDGVQVLNPQTALNPSEFANGKIGSVVTVSGASSSIIKNWSGGRELFVTVKEDSGPTSWLTLDNVDDNSSTVDLHVRFSGSMNLPTIFCVFQIGSNDSHLHGGDMYVEFSGDLVVTQGTYSMTNDDRSYPSEHSSVAISAFFANSSKNEKGCVDGKITYVINKGTYKGCIVGGAAYGVDDEETRVTKGVEIYLNGGAFEGDIYAGGTCGYIGGAKIVITGGLTMSFNDNVHRISAGGFGVNNKGGLANGKAAEIVLQDITGADGIAQWKGELSGGRKPTNFEVRRTLALKNVTTALEATLADFDEVQVEDGSIVQLKGLGEATALSVSSGSKLTLGEGEYTGMVTTNGGEIVLEDGASYKTALAKIGDDQVAMSTKGTYSIGAGSSLELGADADGRVRGAVDVNLLAGGTYTTSLTGNESGDGSVLVTLSGGGQYTVGASAEGVTIRLHLSGMTSDSSIAAGESYTDYKITLVGENAIELGEGMKRTAFFGTTGAVELEEGASLRIGVDSILADLRGPEAELTYKVAGCDLTAWNEGGVVQIAREVQLSGRNPHFDKEGNLVLTGNSVPHEDLYWSGDTDTNGLTWGGAGADSWATTSGGEQSAAWSDRASAHLSGGASPAAITMQGDVIVNNLEFNAGTYAFSGGQALFVMGDLTVVNDTTPTVDFGSTSVEVWGGLTIGTACSFTFAEPLSVKGRVKWWGGGTLTLSAGGTLGELDPSWNGDGAVVLGADLTLTGGLVVQNNGRRVAFKKADGAGDVYLVFKTGDAVKTTYEGNPESKEEGLKIQSHNNNGKYLFDGVGLAAKGSGTALKLLDGEETTWDIGGNLLAAEQGTLVIDGAHPMVVTGKIIADNGTLSATNVGANVSAAGLEIKNGASITTRGAWTIEGDATLDAGSTLNIVGGSLAIDGGVMEGELVLGGTLETGTGDLTIANLRLSGGALDIGGNTVIKALADGSSSLTSLSIAEGKKLTLNNSGIFKISGEFHWGSGSELELGAAGLVLDFTGLSVFGDSASGENLTLNLASAFLEGAGEGNSCPLFTGWDPSRKDQITLKVDGSDPSGQYTGLEITDEGELIWGNSLYWETSSDAITLGIPEGTEEVGVWSEKKGSPGTLTWSENKNIHLSSSSETITVTVGRGASMDSLSISAAGGSATYNFVAGAGDLAKVTGKLSVGAGATVSVGEDVTLTAGSYGGDGSLRVEGGEVRITAEATISSVTLTGGSMTLSGGGTISNLQGTATAGAAPQVSSQRALTIGGGDYTGGLTSGGLTVNGDFTYHSPGEANDPARVGALTVNGRFTLEGSMQATALSGTGSIVGGGTLRLNANSGSFSGEVGVDLVHQGGKFTLSGYTGKNVTVTSGSLTLANGGRGMELTTLAIGKDASLAVAGGNLNVSDVLTWGAGSELIFSSAGQRLVLSGDGWDGKLDATQGKLTIVLGADVLGAGASGNITLLEWANKGEGFDFTGCFDIELSEGVNPEMYKELILNPDGSVSWGIPNDLYWDAAGHANNKLTWGGAEREWSKEAGGPADALWPGEDTAGTNVHITGEADADYTVEMQKDILAGSVEFNGGDYAFSGGDGSMLTTQGDLTVGTDRKTTVDFGDRRVDVGKSLATGSSSRVTIGGKLDVGGDLTAGEESKLLLKGDTTVKGGVTLGKGSSATVSGKLDVAGTVNAGNGSLAANGGGTWGGAQLAQGGSLSLKNTTVQGELKAEGGKLTVGGRSSLGSVSGRLTGLEIAPGGDLTVQGGNGLQAESFTWSSGSTLHLGKEFTGPLSFGSLNGNGSNLTLDFSKSFLKRLGEGGKLFADVQGFEAGWNEKFDLRVNGATPDSYYGNMHIDEGGNLVWDAPKPPDTYDSSTDNVETGGAGTEEGKTEWNTGDKNIYDSVGDYGGVIVNSDTNIDFSGADKESAYGNWDTDGLTVHNLQGSNPDAKLTITGNGKDNNKVTLKNSYDANPQYTDDLHYDGGITVDNAELHINHEDPTTDKGGAKWGTTMGGKLDLSGANGLYMDRGVLTLTGDDNDLGSAGVNFDHDKDGHLVISGGSAMVSGRITANVGGAECDPVEDRNEHIKLENNGLLRLVGRDEEGADETTVGAGVIIGGGTGSEIVGVKGAVNMETGSRLRGVHLILEDEKAVLRVGKEAAQPAPASVADEPAMARAASIDEPELPVDAGASDSGDVSIYGIQSNGGRLTGRQDIEMSVQGWDHVFTGSMGDYEGKMTFNSGPNRQYFTQVTKGSANWDMEVGCLAQVTLSVLNAEGENAGWTMGNMALRSGSDVTLGFTFASPEGRLENKTGMRFQGFTVEEGARLTLQAYGSVMPSLTEFVLGEVSDGGVVDLHSAASPQPMSVDGAEANGDDPVGTEGVEEPGKTADELMLSRDQLVGSAWLHVESASIVHEDNKLKLKMQVAKDNLLEAAVAGAHRNAVEGARALWEFTSSGSNAGVNEALSNPDSDTNKLVGEALRLLYAGGGKAGLANLLAAGAGAGYTGYSAALAEDMHRQLSTIRNRVASMGEDVPQAATDGEGVLVWHAWVNAESSYRELDADGLAPGYRLNGWGGTFGVDADISRNTVVGLALSAMYNDLKCTGADTISGDMDTMYATAFLRHMRGRWTHTLAISEGLTDFKTHRTVATGSGNYTADADTNGWAVGALYEAGYTALLHEKTRSALQYILNVEVRYNNIDGFTESGSDAGLQVEEMDNLTVTFGAGARVQSMLGENLANRGVLFEARLLAKADAGDRRGEAATRFANGSYRTSMVGAEVGAVGIEAGAGLTIPFNGPRPGSFFIDGSLEFRQGWSSFDASAGLRFRF